MSYIYTNETIKHSLKHTLIQGLTVREYSKFTDVDVIEESKDTKECMEVKLALIFRTEKELLRTNLTTFSTLLPLKCFRLGQKQNFYRNNYVNMLGNIANHMFETYKLNKVDISTKTHPEPLGIVVGEETLYYVFEVFVDDTLKTNFKLDTYLTWFDLHLVNKYFKSDDYLDNILVPNLKFLNK